MTSKASERATRSHEQKVWRSIWLRLGVTAVVLLGGYLAVALWVGGRTASGTSVAGVDVGGMDASQARQHLSQEASRLQGLPVTVVVGGDRVQVTPAAAGLAIDVNASLRGLTERSLNPADVIRHFTDGTDHPAVVRGDQTRMADAIDTATGKVLTGAPQNGSVTLSDGRVDVVRSTPGEGVDADRIAAQVRQGWPGKRQYTATLTSRPARLSNTEIDRFVKEFATPAMSQPLKVTRASVTAELSPRQLSELITVQESGARLSAHLDGAGAIKTALEQQPALQTPARNAKVTLVAGKPAITPGADGTVIDQARTTPVLLAALTSPSHEAKVVTTAVKPRLSTEQVKSIDTTHVMSEFHSPFPTAPSNAARTQNMRVALGYLNGIVVAPGEQFSLVNALGGEMTKAKGYVDAPTIQGGHERPALGGGVSQVSTTVYNTAFFAGVQLDEHKAHSFWIPRYPMGREATLWIGTIDNKWTNDTGAPILIQAGIEGDEVVMRWYGKKVFTVETSTGTPTSYTQPKTVHDKHPGCIPVSPQRGFTVQVHRVVKKGSAVVKDETITTTYKAADHIICS